METEDHAFALLARRLAACAAEICRPYSLRDSTRYSQSDAQAARTSVAVSTRFSRKPAADVEAAWATGPLPPELALNVFALAAGDWRLRCVCRGCARIVEVAAASARLVLDSQAAFELRAALESAECSVWLPIHAVDLGLHHESSIFFFSGELRVRLLPTGAADGTDGEAEIDEMRGEAEFEVWCQAGEPYGPQSDRIATWRTLWHLDIHGRKVVFEQWTLLDRPHFDWVPVVSPAALPQHVTVKKLMSHMKA
eukprot:gnl/TRDRNA2_/TRDRNA2_138940_c0_seq2.p1 gnl/TRDRNA2_/TRDRNA2_138940_c0~~gnl/TRDRNA2_/TRDRNA2_138940_c0_seq2.p1  ORF type:complete len:253 (-),score=37.45 gnl/TRDRNA2_/TRDRNA2_138940_c0_seq2:235-993(-)